MAFDRITASDISGNQVQGAPDFPIGTPQQKKQIFDKLPLKIIERVNALITKLESSAVNGGSSNIGSPPISGVDGTTVLTQLQSLKQQLTEVVVGTIPDATLTKAKFVDFDGDVMDAELKGYVEAESAAGINDTDSVVVAFGKLQKTLNDLIDALQDYKDNIADGTVTADRAKTVTTDLNGRPLTAVFVGESAKVQSAVQADRASYASADTAKGTIDERLDEQATKRTLFFEGAHETSSNGSETTINRTAGSNAIIKNGSMIEVEFNNFPLQKNRIGSSGTNFTGVRLTWPGSGMAYIEGKCMYLSRSSDTSIKVWNSTYFHVPGEDGETPSNIFYQSLTIMRIWVLQE